MARRIDRVLLGAFIVSALGHLTVAVGPGWALPDLDEDRPTRIDAQLIAAAAPAGKAEAVAAIEPAPSPKPRPKPKPKPKPQPAPTPTPQTPMASVGNPPPPQPEAPASSPAEATGDAATAPAETAASGDAAAGADSASQQIDSKTEMTEADDGVSTRYAGTMVLPREARIAFSLILGSIQVGEALQTWSRDERGYRLRIVMETTGAARLFKSLTITQTSAGGFYPGGLRPRKFSYEQTGRDTSHTTFDWKQMKVSLDRGDNHREFALEDGAQDLLSLAYQLGLAGSGGQAEVGVASGKNYYRNGLEWTGEDTVRTAAGDVRALHVRTTGQDNMTEIWIAPDLQNLPVRIKFTDRNGTATQLVANSIVADGRTLLGTTKQAQEQ